jgi:hypothetical protein
VEIQIESARKVWAKIGKIVRKNTNNNPKVLSAVHKTIALSVMLYGAETWVTYTTILSKLNCFHNHCTRTITGRHIRLLEDGT